MKNFQDTLDHEPMAATSLQGEVIQTVDEAEIKALFPGGSDLSAQNLYGVGFTYRHDWGNHNGQKTYTLNIGSVNANSRVFVSATEFGGGANEGFIGNSRYTVHNVAVRNGAIVVRLNVEWNSPIRVRMDYLIVNP